MPFLVPWRLEVGQPQRGWCIIWCVTEQGDEGLASGRASGTKNTRMQDTVHLGGTGVGLGSGRR